LLLNRRELPPRSREILVGDDTEADAFIYSVYGDILAGRLRGEALRQTLRKVPPQDVDYVERLAAELPAVDAVTAIFIHLARRRGPAAFSDYGLRVYPIADYFQAAASLAALAQIGLPGLARVAEAVAAAGCDVPASFEDACRRGLIAPGAVSELSKALGCPPPVLDPAALPEPPEPGPAPGFLTPASLRAPPGP
jgi:hypothetical protein